MLEIIVSIMGSAIVALLGGLLVVILKFNTTITALQSWMEGHEKQDDSRHEENIKKFDAIFRVINSRYWSKGQYEGDEG